MHTDTTDYLMHEVEENWTQSRQSEDQRAILTNVIVIIASITNGVLTQTGFNKNALPLTILLIILGFYGAIANAKLYERHQFHVHRARKLRERLEELCPESHVRKLLNDAGEEHYAKYPVLAKNIRLNKIWLVFPILIAVLGVIYTIIILGR